MISRWERAKLPLPPGVVLRYEELLDLPRCHLMQFADLANRYVFGPRAQILRSPLRLGRGATEDRVHELLEQAMSDGVMSGLEWDELTHHLRVGNWLLHPRVAWARLAERLLDEMLISDGTAANLRAESLDRLVAHPRGRLAAVAACVASIRDRRNPSPIDTIEPLVVCDHPTTSGYVLEQLANPASDGALWGAVLVSAQKLRHGQFSERQRQWLAANLCELLADPTYRYRGHTASVELLRQMAQQGQARSIAQLRRLIAADEPLGEVLDAGRLLSNETARVVVDRITASVVSSRPRDVSAFTDRVLPQLLDEILFSPNLDSSTLVAQLLNVSPYRRAVASALAAELAHRDTLSRPDFVVSLLRGLRTLGDERQRPLLERLIVAPGMPAIVALEAASAIGHVGGASDELYWRRAIQHHRQQWRTGRNTTSDGVLRNLVYALGIGRTQLHLLRMIHDDPTMPDRARSSATRWLDVPEHIYLSART